MSADSGRTRHGGDSQLVSCLPRCVPEAGHHPLKGFRGLDLFYKEFLRQGPGGKIGELVPGAVLSPPERITALRNKVGSGEDHGTILLLH